MDSMKSLSAPIRQFTSCMTGTNTGKKRGGQPARRNSFTRRKSISRRRSLPCTTTQKVPDSWLRVYQADLQRERKRQQAKFAKKNAERNVRRTFRSQHCLPRQTHTAKKPVQGTNDSLFGAFQGLSLDGWTGGSQGAPVAATAAGGAEQCKVM